MLQAIPKLGYKKRYEYHYEYDAKSNKFPRHAKWDAVSLPTMTTSDLEVHAPPEGEQLGEATEQKLAAVASSALICDLYPGACRAVLECADWPSAALMSRGSAMPGPAPRYYLYAQRTLTPVLFCGTLATTYTRKEPSPGRRRHHLHPGAVVLCGLLHLE